MINKEMYIKILNYFDQLLWNGKTDYTGWNYFGLMLDKYFENSILCIDYLNIENYFEENGGFSYVENKYLVDQFENIPESHQLLLIQNILIILNNSKLYIEQNKEIILKISNVLKRFNVKVLIPENGLVTVSSDDIYDSGSYCNVIKIKDGILKKILKPIYQRDEQYTKRMKYEYENMQKLIDCPQILNVFNFNPDDNSYLMEQCEKNLYQHMIDEIDIPFEKKLKIIMDILLGMKYAHEKSIIHRDLHLGNILKTGNDFVVCDFGLSKDLSIERSLKSSKTAMNNHIFVDPLAFSDFTKLDQKSDIYSIGKIIDYVFAYNTTNPNHIFKTVVERCVCRDKALRYDTVHLIITDIETILKSQGQENDRQNTISKIINSIYDSCVHEYIMDLIHTDRLNQFIVSTKLIDFGSIVIKFESVYQVEILHSILSGFIQATGYGGWHNYDIFARIAYFLCINIDDLETRKIAKTILEECARVRYEAKELFERLPI